MKEQTSSAVGRQSQPEDFDYLGRTKSRHRSEWREWKLEKGMYSNRLLKHPITRPPEASSRHWGLAKTLLRKDAVPLLFDGSCWEAEKCDVERPYAYPRF